jgi:cell division protein FtsL
MNIAINKISTYSLPRIKIPSILLTKQFVSVFILLLAIFTSAIGVIYVQAKNRNLFGELQSLQKNRDGLNVEWGQLILEQNTWSAQARVGEIAQEELKMVVPTQKDIDMVTK